MSKPEIIFMSGDVVDHILKKLSEDCVAELDFSQEFAQKHINGNNRSFGQNIAMLVNILNVCLLEAPKDCRNELAFCVCEMLRTASKISVDEDMGNDA